MVNCLFNLHLQVFPSHPLDFGLCWFKTLIISLPVEITVILLNRLLRLQPSHLSFMHHWASRQNMGLIGVIDPDHQGDAFSYTMHAERIKSETLWLLLKLEYTVVKVNERLQPHHIGKTTESSNLWVMKLYLCPLGKENSIAEKLTDGKRKWNKLWKKEVILINTNYNFVASYRNNIEIVVYIFYFPHFEICVCVLDVLMYPLHLVPLSRGCCDWTSQFSPQITEYQYVIMLNLGINMGQ